MSERKNGKFLYVHEHQQLYSFATNNKDGQSFRCVKYTAGCLSRVNLNETEKKCVLCKNFKPHTHLMMYASAYDKQLVELACSKSCVHQNMQHVIFNMCVEQFNLFLRRKKHNMKNRLCPQLHRKICPLRRLDQKHSRTILKFLAFEMLH